MLSEQSLDPDVFPVQVFSAVGGRASLEMQHIRYAALMSFWSEATGQDVKARGIQFDVVNKEEVKLKAEDVRLS